MKRHLRQPGSLAVAAAAALLLSAAAVAHAAPMGDTATPIKLAMNEWTGQHVTTHIAGQLLEKMGYKVEYVTAGLFPQFSGVADGSLSATLEIWTNNVGDIYPKVLAEKKVEDIGGLGLATKDGWIYPAYMKDVCPGLPDWTALKAPACVAALATPETFPNARLLDYPADWGSISATVIKNAELPLTTVPGGSEGALIAELESAAAAHKPLLMRFWAPHWVLSDVPVEWVKMPPCPSNKPDDCITAPTVQKVVWSGFGEKWPAAYEFLKGYQLDAEDQQPMMLEVDKKNVDLDKVAGEWIATHAANWQPWMDAAKK